MKFLPSSLGAEPKKVMALGGLLLFAVVMYWYNSLPEGGGPVAAAPVAVPVVATRPAPSATPAPQQRNARSMDDFRPSLKRKEGIDISKVDPTLRLDLLAKLQEVPLGGGTRSLFEFSQPPAPPTPVVKPIIPTTPVASVPTPAPVTASKEVAPVKPPPPPITLKFYGYAGTTRSGKRQGFFLDGEDIFVAGETEVIRNRYKVVRIGVNSAVVEDTSNQNQQPLPLVEEVGG